MSSNDTHDRYQLELVEYTLGVLDGRARALLLTHVEACEECADELGELNRTADALLHVSAGADPPIGFESRVMERIATSRPTTLRHRPRSRTLVSWAAAVAVLAFGLGWAVNHVTASPVPSATSAGTIEQRSLAHLGHTVGLVYAYTGNPSWMFVTVNAPGAPAVVRCVVVTKGGRTSFVGSFNLVNGHGAWGTPLPVRFASVKGVELTTPNGVVIASLTGAVWISSKGRWS